ncbi:MAG TPA: hypothetical protein VGP47_08240 [Parachlamydiaceae bacterium]|nr:hypothetical protein [Parachlamydiaceae bacterium]
MKIFIIFFAMLINLFLCWESFGNLPPDIDLEKMASEYVVETKQLKFPDYPTACNASIVRWKDKLILSFNAYSIGKDDQPDLMGLAILDEDFNVINNPQILDVPKNLWQDARLVVLNECLYLVYNGAIEGNVRRMFIAQAHFNGIEFSLEPPIILLNFPGETSAQWEKNWIPFVYNNYLLLSTHLSPHRILRPILGSQNCEGVASSNFSYSWKWGKPKGGTTAHTDGNYYLAFFHSVKVMPSIHSEGEPIQHYFMGAYLFENCPPFKIKAMTKEPIIGKHFYHGPEYTMCKPCRVVFPCGFVMNEKFIWIVFGRQDHEIWMAKLDKKKLYDNMESCDF